MTADDPHGPLAPLDSLLREHTVSAVLVDAPDRVYVERNGRLEQTGVQFASEAAVRAAIDAVLAVAGQTLARDQTTAYARLRDGTAFIAALPPTAPYGPCFVLRKLLRPPLTWQALIDDGVLSAEAVDALRQALDADMTMVVAGTPGSGLARLIEVLIATIPEERRVLVVEEVAELDTRHPRALRLESGMPPRVALDELIALAARMRPDRLVVGELRGTETFHALQLMRAGHPGIMGLHAASPEDAVRQLETLCLMSNLGLGLEEIRAVISAAVGLMVFLERLPAERRRVTQVAVVRGMAGGQLVIDLLYVYDHNVDRLLPTGTSAPWERR
jgi:pilus assembly protein CpaF